MLILNLDHGPRARAGGAKYAQGRLRRWDTIDYEFLTLGLAGSPH